MASSRDADAEGRLRAGSLLFWKAMMQERPECDVSLHGGWQARATFASCDAALFELHFKSFPSPMGTFPSVIVRGSDALEMTTSLPADAAAAAFAAAVADDSTSRPVGEQPADPSPPSS